jgi:peptidoglycan/LPS O-acetylase OafA/YrhL
LRNSYLDIARGLLALGVVLVHLLWFSGFRGLPYETFGAYCVQGFMALSGYVITQLCLTKREPYGQYIVRRALRLYPAYLVVLGFGTLLSLGTPHLPAHLLAHLSLLHGLVPDTLLPGSAMSLLVPAWSISLEFQFYLILPLLLLFIGRFQFRGLVVLWVIALILIRRPFCDLMNEGWSSIGAFLPQRFAWFLSGITACIFIQRPEFVGAPERRRTAGPQKPLVHLVHFVHLGEISYSAYLLHFPMMAAWSLFIPADWSPALKLLCLGSILPLIYSASVFLYQTVEKPGMALGKRIGKGSGNRNGKASLKPHFSGSAL